MKKFLLILEIDNERILQVKTEEVLDIDENFEELNLIGKFSI
mgnify:CR=1 FL=1